MTNLIQNYKKWNIPNYFNILAETAYCILKFQSKAIVQ